MDACNGEANSRSRTEKTGMGKNEPGGYLNQLKEGDAFLDALAHANPGAACKVVAIPACTRSLWIFGIADTKAGPFAHGCCPGKGDLYIAGTVT